jgi:1-acylglycerone phosphate reductase
MDKKMSNPKRTVLITGCSEGGLGAALAIAFHDAGLHVYATARNPAKMAHLAALGIETLPLDVLSDASIAECVGKLSHLDILVNNAGGGYSMPISDLSIPEAKKLFDLNVWSYLAVTQAFLPLLLKSNGMVVNQTSLAAVVSLPFQSTYNASKAAMAMFSDSLRLELQPFGVTVVDLKTGSVTSNFQKNHLEATQATLPANSIYEPAKAAVEKTLSGEEYLKSGIPAGPWAAGVVQNLLKKSPPSNIWTGKDAWLVRLSTILPFGTMDGMIRKMTGLNAVEKAVRK